MDRKDMKKRAVAFCVLFCWLLLVIPLAQTQESLLRIYFVDIGQGHAALIVSPTGKTLLVDGGPDGAGTSAILPLMQSLGLAALDVIVATHYDADHIGGLDEVAAAFPPGIAYDSGDLTVTNGSFIIQYLNTIRPVRARIRPGTVIDLGGGAFATCITVNGDLISGGRVGIFGRNDQYDQLNNSASISLLIQYGDFDLFISGDLTGGGNNTTDVESTVAQFVGDVDVLQLNHHGSATSSNATFLTALKAEVGIVQAGRNNSFGHPTIEVTDRFINTTPTSGIRPTPPDDDAPANRLPFVFQNQISPSGSSVSHQGIFARGTIILETDGQTYSIRGGRLPRIPFTSDGAEAGVRTDFPPSVISILTPIVPRADERVLIQAQIADDSGVIDAATLAYSINGGPKIMSDMNRLSSIDFTATIPGQPDGTLVRYSVTARDGAGQVSVARGGYFAGTTPIQALRVNDDWGVPQFLDFPARIAGMVTVGNGTFSSTNTDGYVQDATGGINVFQLRSQNPQLTMGDMVTVAGRVALFNGVTMLDIANPIPNVPFTSPFGITNISSGGDATPVVRTLAQIDESVEGMLVRVNDVRIVEGAIPANGSNGNLVIADATGELTLRVLRETEIPGMATPRGTFSLIGIVGQFDRFRPFHQGYQMLPRNRSDLILP
jgi:beta-lactamase superfamily II metal-dependent hydrolase